VSVSRRKLIAAAGAIGLALGVGGQATGSPGHPAARHATGAKADQDAKLAVFDRPARRFRRSVEIARRKAMAERAALASSASTSAAPPAPAAGGTAAPESLGVSSAALESIAACESGGDPSVVSADGAYRGKYQFDYGTWASVGGSGDPAAAPEAEQDYRAALLYSRGGSSPWPNCGS
jgi:hypothetical protein